MATEETKGTLYICDACGKQYFIPDGGEIPLGYHGRIMVIAGGGDFFEFFSCKENDSHIINALRNAKKSFERGDRE